MHTGLLQNLTKHKPLSLGIMKTSCDITLCWVAKAPRGGMSKGLPVHLSEWHIHD